MLYGLIFGFLVSHGAQCVGRERGESGQPVVIAARRKKASEVNSLCWRREELEGAPLDITPW
jgi:hypothetical protein